MKTHLFTYLTLLILISLSSCFTSKKIPQKTHQEELPYSFQHDLKKPLLVEEIVFSDKEIEEKLKKNKSLIPKIIDRNSENTGVWENLPNGDKVWRLGIKVAQAKTKGISLSFTQFDIPIGGRLFAYNQDKSFVIGPFTKSNHYSGGLVFYGIPGEIVVIEYFEPKSVPEKSKINLKGVTLNLSSFPYSFTHPLNNQNKIPTEKIFFEDVRKTDPYATGNRKDTSIVLLNHGLWTDLPNGDRVWQLKIQPVVKDQVVISMGLEWKNIKTPTNCELYIYTEDRSFVKKAGIGSTQEMRTDVIILEYYETKEQKGKAELEINRVSYITHLY